MIKQINRHHNKSNYPYFQTIIWLHYWKVLICVFICYCHVVIPFFRHLIIYYLIHASTYPIAQPHHAESLTLSTLLQYSLPSSDMRSYTVWLIRIATPYWRDAVCNRAGNSEQRLWWYSGICCQLLSLNRNEFKL